MFLRKLGRIAVLAMIGSITIACGGTVHSDVNFERRVVFDFTQAFVDRAIEKKTLEQWYQAADEAPLLFNDKPDLSLPPMILTVYIADTEDPDRSRFNTECNVKKNQLYTPYGTTTIYVCAENFTDQPPEGPEDPRRHEDWGLWKRIALFVHEAGHALAGALHISNGAPGIMCGSPYVHPTHCFVGLTGFTSQDKIQICRWVGGGGFCDHPVAQRP